MSDYIVKTCKIHGELTCHDIYKFERKYFVKKINNTRTSFQIVCKKCDSIRTANNRKIDLVKYKEKEKKRRGMRKIITPSYYSYYDKKYNRELSDSYIKKLLTSKDSLQRSDIPVCLIELKRQQIKLKRLLKKGT